VELVTSLNFRVLTLDNNDENSDSSSYVSHGVEFFDVLGFDDDEDIDFDYTVNEE
jgi:hypothetical protein